MTKELLFSDKTKAELLRLFSIEKGNRYNGCNYCNHCDHCDHCNYCDHCIRQEGKMYMVMNVQLTKEEYLLWEKKL